MVEEEEIFVVGVPKECLILDVAEVDKTGAIYSVTTVKIMVI